MGFIMSLPFDEGAELINHAIHEENTKVNLINWLISGNALNGVSFDAYKERLKSDADTQTAEEIFASVESMFDRIQFNKR